MKKNLKDCTFIIPIRIESEDRLRNIITVLCYILGNFDTNIIVKEVDCEKKFEQLVLPQVKEFCGDVQSLKYFFEMSNDPIFLRTKILNEMIESSQTKVIVNYDCDVIFPLSSYEESYNRILQGINDVIYPYGEGHWQYKVNADDELVSEFLNENYDFNILKNKSYVDNAGYGWVQFFNKNVYIEGGMENENFKSWGPEDFERFFRFSTLGYNIGRIDNWIYHLEHSRGFNSYYNNPYHQHNVDLWNKIQKMSKQELKSYYSQQQYLKKYKK